MSNPTRQRGFTLIEVLVALLIVATTIATLQTISSATLRSAVETNRLRVAKMLLRQKAEEIAAGTEQGTTGSFEGFPGYTWEVVEVELPASENPPESVRHVGIRVRMPSLEVSQEEKEAVPEGEDEPGTVRVETYLDPPNAVLHPP